MKKRIRCYLVFRFFTFETKTNEKLQKRRRENVLFFLMEQVDILDLYVFLLFRILYRIEIFLFQEATIQVSRTKDKNEGETYEHNLPE